MMSIEDQTRRLVNFITVSASRGRSEDEIIRWGFAPDYREILNTLEATGKVYHTSKMFSGVRYFVRGRP